MEIKNGVYKASLSKCQAKILPNEKRTPAIECVFDVDIDGTTVVKRYTAFVSGAALSYTIQTLAGCGVTEKEMERIENGEESVDISFPTTVSVKIENESYKDKVYANIKSVYTKSFGLGEAPDKNEFRKALGGQSLSAAFKAEIKSNPSLASVKNAAAVLQGKEPKFNSEEEVPF